VFWFEWGSVKASRNQIAAKGNNTCSRELNSCLLEALLKHCVSMPMYGKTKHAPSSGAEYEFLPGFPHVYLETRLVGILGAY
jgi:hypothetical protein